MSVFLTMYRNEKPWETQKCSILAILKTIDFTRLKGTFEEKIMFSFNGIYRETQNVTF